MRACMRLTTDANYQARGASLQLLRDPSGVILARHDSKSGISAGRKQGNLT